jgi:hypothetical protein
VVEVTEQPSCEFLVVRSIDDEVFLIRRRQIDHRSLLGGPPCSNTGEHEEISNGDTSGGGDPDGTDKGVLVSVGDGLPSLEGERERLVPLLSFIIG